MVVYTLEQPWEILRDFFENHGNIAECVRKLRTDFGRREAPLESGPAIELQKMPILARKSSFQMKLILILAGM